MATFPLLKTGAVTQYPLLRSTNVSTQSVRFLDGSRQTFSINGGGLRRWSVSLNLLDETEVSAVLKFAESVGTGTFTFTDPGTGETANKCVLSGGEVDAALTDELNGKVALEIEEVK